MSAPASGKVTGERLQKYLARAGISSRRHAEELIAAGRVRVDGHRVTELGTKVEGARARVEVDGRLVLSQPCVYIVLHKPRGTVTTLRDPEGRPTVASLVTNLGVRVVPVGRLDFATSGVLLMTNDGDFQAKLQHPTGGAKKVYHAKVRGVVDERSLERWRRSIDIDGRSTRPADVKVLECVDDKTWLEISISEGKNRQIRRLGEQAGHPVSRLIRVEYAGLNVSELRPGAWRHLTRQELLDLKQRFGVPRRIPHATPIEAPTGRRAGAPTASRVKTPPKPQTQAKRGFETKSRNARTNSPRNKRVDDRAKPKPQHEFSAMPTHRRSGR